MFEDVYLGYMRRIFKIFSFVLAMVSMVSMTAQVQSVSHALSFHASSLIVDKGETLSKLDKSQFNSQLSIIAPSGTRLEVAKYFMPFNEGYLINRKLSECVISDVASAPKEDSRIMQIHENGEYKKVGDWDFSKSVEIENSNQTYKDIVMIDNEGVGMYVQQEND
ncbi:MAG: hypothetical protein ACJA1A_001856 [Saprospiraceae bacterium]|jgi:hypothetical protein|tara:strand:- start:527 stop:1021 length:495 start_codon:yes stop_codon:yes gene_type:complete